MLFWLTVGRLAGRPGAVRAERKGIGNENSCK